MSSWLNQMIHSLDIPERLYERNKLVVDSSSLHDAKRSFDSAIDSLLRKAMKVDNDKLAADGIFCRETFEKKFSLVFG